MGVYIDMKMPKDCIKCRFCLFTGVYWKCLVDGSHADFGGTCRPSKCPLVPVPPHGDLIDYDFCMQNYELLHDDDGNPVYAVRMREINSAPTIIPAEGG